MLNVRTNATGFISSQAGSVASANAMLLREILRRGVEVDFFAKPSFIDPREAIADLDCKDRLRLVDCTNHFGDGLRRHFSPGGRGLWGRLWGSIDAVTYNQGLVRRMKRHPFGDVDLWLGDWARGRGSRPVISFAQGPPGTDARSAFKHIELISKLAGRGFAIRLAVFAKYRLSLGLPHFHFSNQIIVGSQWSRECLEKKFGIAGKKTVAIPYPIDLDLFRPAAEKRSRKGPLKLLWLGRFAPRKRLDLFLDGLAEAIRQDCDVTATVVGSSDFVPNYEQLLSEFPFHDRLDHIPNIPRTEVPSLIWDHDVMCQPSDEENFGSSVAEALACGVPSIVGTTNGTGDYICNRSIRLEDESVSGMASSIARMADAKRDGELADTHPSRLVAESHFSVTKITDQLLEIAHSCLNLT